VETERRKEMGLEAGKGEIEFRGRDNEGGDRKEIEDDIKEEMKGEENKIKIKVKVKLFLRFN
jgi:hypothetical protein